jgi:hypothetical protein
MRKLIAQVLTAAVIVSVLVALHAHWMLIVVVAVAGFAAVHIIWERFVFKPFDYLGVMPVHKDDPLIIEAERKARETRDHFFTKLYPEHKEDSMVKVAYVNADGETEKIWGDLVDVAEEDVEIFIRTPPIKPKPDCQQRMRFPRSAIVDWSVEFRDGTLRGGFSNLALFKIFERQEGYMHPAFKKHVDRFKDIGEPAKTP